MRNVIPRRVSVRKRRSDRTRIVALVGTYLLLIVGLVVSAPGLMNASATGSTPAGRDSDSENNDGNDDGNDDGHHNACESEDSGQNQDDGDDGDQNQDETRGDDGSGRHDSSGESSTSQTFTAANPGASDGDDDGHHDGHHDGHDDGHHDGDDDGNDDGNADCATTATLTLNKIVINDNAGTSTIADFVLTATSSVGSAMVINGPDPSPDSAVGVTAGVPAPASYVLSESGPTGYNASSWSCSAGTLVGDTVTLAAGDVASCTVTNDDTPPGPPPNSGTITVTKDVTNSWGGTLQPVDFQLKLDTNNVPQGAAQTVAAGTHVISELSRPGYVQTDIVCMDAATHAVVTDLSGSVQLATGQNVACTVFNADIAPTLTVIKHVNPDAVPTAAPGSFQLTIDDLNVAQSAPQNEQVGTHTVGEVAVAGYRMVAINCTADGTNTVVAYTSGVTLALDQHVTCVVTNQHDAIDLAITKTVSAAPKVAGGSAFDYTITVDNLGPRDATASDSVTVTDQLPAGLVFVTLPANCSTALQTLTCMLAVADLQVADPPVVLAVTVRVSADTASGTYTNIAYVNTPGDPACIGNSCVPVCDSASNNVACAATDVIRQSSISVSKVDNVDAGVHPGGSFSYAITVANVGLSAFLPNTTMTDALPADLVLDTVDAASPWTCTSLGTIVCAYGSAMAPGQSAAVITVHVHVSDTVLVDSVTNVAQAIAVVESGNVVTGTDHEVTPILYTADLSIDKSASTAPAVVGSTFDWQLDVVNHGPDTATNLVIDDAMPPQFRVESATSATAGASCNLTASSVHCTLATLSNGASSRITVHVTVLGPAGATTNNSATVDATSLDPTLLDNTDAVLLAVVDGQASSPPVPVAAVPVAAVPVAPIPVAPIPVAPIPVAPTPVPVPVIEPQLPRTGGSYAGTLGLGVLLLGAGVVSAAVARRRRSANA